MEVEANVYQNIPIVFSGGQEKTHTCACKHARARTHKHTLYVTMKMLES